MTNWFESLKDWVVKDRKKLFKVMLYTGMCLEIVILVLVLSGFATDAMKLSVTFSQLLILINLFMMWANDLLDI